MHHRFVLILLDVQCNPSGVDEIESESSMIGLDDEAKRTGKRTVQALLISILPVSLVDVDALLRTFSGRILRKGQQIVLMRSWNMTSYGGILTTG